MSGYGTGPGNLVLLATNVLDAGTVTTTPTTSFTARLNDRARGLQWVGVNTGIHDMLVTLAAATSVGAAALVNHNVTGLTIELAGSATGTFTSPFTTATVTGDPFLLLFAAQSFRFYNLRIPAGAAIPRLGEFLLGTPQVLVLPPSMESTGPTTLGNVRRDTSPAGVTWAVRRGAKRTQLPFAWNGLDGTDLVTLQTAYDATEQGAKNLIVRDELGVVRWMSWDAARLAPIPVGGGLYSLAESTFTEALS
jgi:hypothetical protein